MDQNPRCENCGRKRPCEPCEARARQAREDAYLDEVCIADGKPLIVWFDLPRSAAWEHLNRLLAEWPGAFRIILPTEPGDSLGCNLALTAADLSKNPSNYEVSATRVRQIDDEMKQAIAWILGRPV